MIVSIIVAVAENGVIGSDNRLIWHIPGDLKRFKSITMGHPIVMGRKTFESIGKPLPGRTNVIISRNKNYEAGGCLVYSSLEVALHELRHEKEIFIIGGGEIYRQALPVAQKLYLTKIHQSFPGDTFFPEINPGDWKINFEETIPADGKLPFSYSNLNLERNR